MDVTEPVVRTAAGLVRGRAKDGVAVFRGIPFAQPPVGDLRFAAPRPARPWDGVREAATFGPPPPQSGFLLTPMSPAAPDADPDDWLTVNVFSPDLGAAGLPVMVWIYGGAYRFGASSLLGYDGTPLARQNVVVVTFNHRIGVEGYAYLPGVPANRALLDQVAALRWVRENIAAFGGDPDRVTVFGESAGAGAIASLLVMPAAAGLFRRAIAQSVPGTFFSPGPGRRGHRGHRGRGRAARDHRSVRGRRSGPAGRRLRRRCGPRTTPGGRWRTPACRSRRSWTARCCPWRRGRRSRRAPPGTSTCSPGTTATSTGCSPSCPGCAGRSPTRRPAGPCDGLAGADGEAAYRAAYPDADAETLFELVYSDWLFRMPTLHLAQAHAAAGGRTFLYQVSYPASESGLGACHAIDVPLVFGVYQGIGQMLFGPEPPASAVALGDLMRSQWAAFAADGDPGWPPYAPGRRTTRIFDDPPDVAPYPERASLHIWDQHRFGILDLSPDLA